MHRQKHEIHESTYCKTELDCARQWKNRITVVAHTTLTYPRIDTDTTYTTEISIYDDI